MAILAINGGRPHRPKPRKWASWPISDAADAKLLAEITKSNAWSYDGPREWDFAEKFTKYLGAKHGLCCANGTVAIQLAQNGVTDQTFVEARHARLDGQPIFGGGLQVGNAAHTQQRHVQRSILRPSPFAKRSYSVKRSSSDWTDGWNCPKTIGAVFMR